MEMGRDARTGHTRKGWNQMITLELTREEAIELQEILREYLLNLRAEIRDTDSSDFKEQLRTEKGVVVKIIEHLEAMLPAVN